MGTRADFYVGKGSAAEWIGSIAWDGYRDGIAGYILKAKTEANYRKAVEVFLKKRDDATFPEQGWPWPWDTSDTTYCSYWFFDGKCWEATGYPTEFYFPCDELMPDEDELGDKIYEGRERVEFPDMTALHKQIATPGSNRSGLMVITSR
jgi:hypothetical protein